MKKIKSLILFLLLALVIFSGCSKKTEKKEIINSVPFSYKGSLGDGKIISIDFDAFFKSKETASLAATRKTNLRHALNMTFPQYSCPQLKGPRLKLLLKDVLNQVFWGKVKTIKINSIIIK